MKTKEVKELIKKEFEGLKEDAEKLPDNKIHEIIIVSKKYIQDNELSAGNKLYMESLIKMYREVLTEREKSKKE